MKDEPASTKRRSPSGTGVEGDAPPVDGNLSQVPGPSQIVSNFEANCVVNSPQSPTQQPTEPTLNEWDLDSSRQGESFRQRAPTPSTSSEAGVPQRYLRLWFVIYGYDQAFIDVFFPMTRAPTQREASNILDIALRQLGWWGLYAANTFPVEATPLLREGRGELWDFEEGVQTPAIPLRPRKALARAYRIREVTGKYPHLSEAKEVWINLEDFQ